MPIPAAVVAAGAGLLGSGINAASQNSINKKTRQWNEKMYGIQKADSLEFWNTQNSYNSPEAQMQRLVKAGLNPNLVYGNGAVANSTSAPSTPHAMGYSPSAPKVDLPNVVDGYFNAQTQAQNLSNQKKIGDGIVLENALKQEALTKSKLDNTFNAENYTSKVRGYLGDNERKYNSAIATYLNRDLLEYLHGYNSVKLTPKGVSSVQDGSPSFMIKQWQQNLQGGALSNQLRAAELKGKGYDNVTRKITSETQERLRRGNLEDMSAKDILQLIMQLIK